MTKKLTPAKVIALDGGDGEPPMPSDWPEIFTDEHELFAVIQEWNLVISEMKTAQTLCVSNGHAIRRLVEFRHHYRKASAHVAQHGPVFEAKSGEEGAQGQWNPQWGVMRHCQKEIQTLETELGISPLRRARVGKVEKRARQSRPSDAYLKRG